MENIKEYYTTTFPADELGQEINPNATFLGLLANIGDTYEYVGVVDSLVRERLFERLAEMLETTYDAVYSVWVKSAYN